MHEGWLQGMLAVEVNSTGRLFGPVTEAVGLEDMGTTWVDWASVMDRGTGNFESTSGLGMCKDASPVVSGTAAEPSVTLYLRVSPSDGATAEASKSRSRIFVGKRGAVLAIVGEDGELGLHTSAGEELGSSVTIGTACSFLARRCSVSSVMIFRTVAGRLLLVEPSDAKLHDEEL